MNKKFAIILSVVTLVLVALLIVLAALRSKPQSDSTDQFAAPTDSPTNRGSNNTYSNGSTNNRSTTPKKQITPVPTLPKAKQEALFTIQNFLPYDSDALAVDYSSLTNKIYVQKKNEKADEEFRKFLETNKLKDTYEKHPELFVTTRSNLTTVINNEEQKMEFSPEDMEEAIQTTPTPTPNKNDPSSQAKPMMNVFKSLMGFNITLLPYSPTTHTQNSQTTQQSNQPQQSNQSAPTQIIYSKDTTNIPCAAGTDNGPADGYTNGVPTKIRVCRVAGIAVNSQVSKQVNDMHAAWTAAGIPLTGGSFRTMSGQISIYQSHCKADGIVGSPPPYPKAPGQTIRCPGAAAPGYSNHQMGMAIDFNCAGTLIPRKYSSALQNKCFQWLSANAGRFGFYEYGMGKTSSRESSGYEGWHWSVNGN